MKLLVVKIGAMGDVLMMTPLLREIRRRQPSAEIHFLVGAWSASVLQKNPHIDKLIVVPDKVFYGPRPFGLLRLWFRLFFTFYKSVYLFHRNRGYFAYFNSLGSSLIGSRRAFFRFLPLFSAERFREGIHHTLAFWEILGGAPSSGGAVQPEFPVATELIDAVKIAALTKEWKKEKVSIMINPGGGNNPGERVTVRQWGAGHYAELIRLLAERIPSFHILFTGGKGDAELCERIIAEPSLAQLRGRMSSAAGKTSLHELRALMDEADLFITGDTGGMHIASAAGIPTLSLFGPTSPEEKAPLIPGGVALRTTAPCAPCYHGKFKGCSYAFCMDDISPRQVLLETERLLQANHAR